MIVKKGWIMSSSSSSKVASLFQGGLRLEEGCQVFDLNAAIPTRVKSEFARNSVPFARHLDD